MSDTSADPTFAADEHGIPAPDRHLPAGTRIGRVRLQVADLDRSVDYYSDVLGLQLLSRSDGEASLGADGDAEPLLELHEEAGARAAPPRGRLGLYHFAILVPDRAALGRLIGHLSELGARVGAADHLVSEAIYLHDPDGLGIEVYADRPLATWRYSGRELQMDTRPLDTADLLRAAGDEPWCGMPAGTRIGHVHLHVGDLRAAEAFYHAGLGLDKVVWSYPGALFLSAGGYHHHLGVNTWAGAAARPPADDDARLLEWELLVPRAEHAEAAARGLQAAGHSVSASGDGWRTADPWSTPLRIRSYRPNE